jgi:hypothetical protein
MKAVRQYFRWARRLSAIMRGQAFERIDASGRVRKISRPPTLSERLAAGMRLEELENARDAEWERLEREQGDSPGGGA